MTNHSPSADVLAAMDARQVPQDKVDIIRKAATEARDLELELKNLEDRLSDTNNKLTKLYHETLPELMDAAGTDHFGLPAAGNAPAVDLKVEPFYKASISVNWPLQAQAEAFAHLEGFGAGSLIKTFIGVSFDKTDRAKAKLLKEALTRQGYMVEEKAMVHHATLTAWLRDEWPRRLRAGLPLPDLEKIGATVGRICKLKPRKETMTTRRQRRGAQD